MDVVVIGAGVVGASAAFRLAVAGARVTVLETARPAAGTSSNSFAWINANDKPPPAYHALNDAGVVEHHWLREDIGGDWLYSSGNLEIAVEPARQQYLRDKVERLRAARYAAELISIEDSRALAPDLAWPDQATVAYYPDEGWVAVPVLIRQLLGAATRAGARVVYPANVEALVAHGDRITGVETADARFSADVVVDCSGPRAGRLLEPLGIAIGRRTSPGLLVVTEPMPTSLTQVIHFDRLHLRPDGAGRVRAGAIDLEEGLQADQHYTAESPECREILRRAVEVLPALAGARIEGVRLGWRPLPADGLTACGPVMDVAGYYLVFTHSGVTLGPRLGRLLAEEIVNGEAQPELTPFRPDRLIRPAASKVPS